MIARRFLYDRGASAAIENRAVVAQWDAQAEELTIWDTTQAPIPIRNGLAARLGLLESQVRVVAPFVGGGFGPKIMMFYPEELLVPWAAMRLGRPVKWTEDRQENFYATTQERGQVHDAEMALTRDGRILGVRDIFLFDTGAYDPYGLTIPINTQCTLLGPYDIPNYDSEFTAVFTNKTDRHAGARRGPAAWRLRQRAAARHRGEGARHRSRRDPEAQPARRRIAFRTTTRSCSRTRRRSSTTAATTCRRWSRRREMIGYEQFLREQPRAARRGQACRRRHRAATSRAPASGRTKARA